MPEVTDHAGHPVTHGRTTVNGVRLHHPAELARVMGDFFAGHAVVAA